MENKYFNWEELINVDCPSPGLEGLEGIASVGRIGGPYTTNKDFEKYRERILNTHLP